MSDGTQTIVKKKFDYRVIQDKQQRSFLQSQETSIKSALGRAHNNLVEVGNRLRDAKESLDHGMFVEWVESVFNMQYHTAVRFMRVAEHFGRVSDLIALPFHQSALYALSVPSVPEEARDEAIARAEAGEVITHKTAQEIVATHKAPPEPDTEQSSSVQDAPQDSAPDSIEVPETSATTINQSTSPAASQPVSNDPQPVGEILGDGSVALYADNPELADDPFESEKQVQKPEDELTDDEWLVTLPLSEKLQNEELRIFQSDALAWRSLKQSGVLGSFKNRVDGADRHGQTLSTTRGPLLSLVRDASRVPHPRDFQLCPACGGSRQYWMNRVTKQHEERGSVQPDESNQLEERCIKMNCGNCKGGYTLT